ncbi:MAG: caspase family protein [Bacteroidota bacterium]
MKLLSTPYQDIIDAIKPAAFAQSGGGAATRQVYAFLVGINDYPSPISELRGCIKDLDRIQSWLSSNVGDRVHLRRIENTDATYENIKAGFREHLRKAGPEDVVWFHFSGHGSEEQTAEEFKATLEPSGKDQTLVCFANQPDQRLHMADKELAVLLQEVASLDEQGQAKGTPHMVVSLDCCHSGSGTRDLDLLEGMKTREGSGIPQGTRAEIAASGKLRTLDSYADGYYARQWKGGKGSLEVPISQHVLLAACESVQTAGDMSSGGIFTHGLMSALEQSKGEINYADLFSLTHSAVFGMRKEQNAQFEPIGNFYPYTKFLDGQPMGSPAQYEVEKERKKWVVKCGAIHGLPVDPDSPIKIQIQEYDDRSSNLGVAEIKSTGAQKSVLSLGEGDQVPGGATLDPEKKYKAILHYLPVPKEKVWVQGEAGRITKVSAEMAPSLYVEAIEGSSQPQEAQFEVALQPEAFVLKDHIQKRTALTEKIAPEEEDSYHLQVVEDLEKMVKWHRTIRLDNPKSSIADWVELELDVMIPGHSPRIDRHKGTSIVLDATKTGFIEHEGGLAAGFQPKMIVKNKSQNIYAYLLTLRSNYAIEAFEGEVVFRPKEHMGDGDPEIPLLKKPIGWGLSEDEQETFAYFKLLVTTEELDFSQLLQNGVGDKERDLVFDWKPMEVKNAWASITMRVDLHR